METFAQLVYQNDDTGRVGASTEEMNALCILLCLQFYVNKTYIHDYPRFKHRGVHLDTARHFLNKEIIVANLVSELMIRYSVIII